MLARSAPAGETRDGFWRYLLKLVIIKSMLSRTSVALLLAACLLTTVGGARADTGDGALVPDSGPLSGFESARLLAGYGEARRARGLAPSPGTGFEPALELIEFEVRLLTEMGDYELADSLIAGHVPVGDDADIFCFYLRRANLNLLAGRYSRALEMLEHTDSIEAPGFSAYRDYIRLRANLGLARPEQAAAAGEAGLLAELPPALSPEFELALIDALSQASNMAPLLELGYELELQSNDTGAARATAYKLARSHRSSSEAERVVVDFLDIVPVQKMKNDELLACAGVMTIHGRYRVARSMLRVLDERPLAGRQREERSIVKARYYYYTGEYKRAIALSKPRFSNPSHRRESMLILARSYRRSGERRRAADVYSHFVETYPNDGKAAEALFVAARLYERTGSERLARETLYKLRKSYPSSYYGRMASYLGAEDYAARNDYDRSAAILEKTLKRSRYTDETAIYYLANTYGKMGRNQDKQHLLRQLEQLDPFSFYLDPGVADTFRRPMTGSNGSVALDGADGLIEFLASASRLKEEARRTVGDALISEDVPVEFAPEVAACIERGTWFLDSGFRDWGERELAHASRHCLDSPATLLELGGVYDRYGLPWHSIRLYQRVQDSIHWKKRREYTREFGYLMYPVPYPVQVLENAAQYDLPPHLVYALIREESRFDRKAVSRVGALGLMQLMPETGRYVARELEMPDLDNERLLDPEVNIAFGIWYASSLYKRSNGNYHRTLAAYNAGPSNARRWFGGSRASLDTIEAVDRIDFRETRLYIQRIVESSNIYRSLYFAPQP
jgi:soluble lytic murein transglycosylase